MRLSITSDEFTLTLPQGYIPTFDVLESYMKILYELDNEERSAVILPAGWELNRI